MDSNQKIQKEFYNKAFSASQPLKDSSPFVGNNFFVERFVRLTIAPGAKKVLEIGCGDGFLTSFLLEKPLQITAVDISEEAIKSIRGKFAKEISCRKLKIVCADVVKFLENTDEKYDAIVGSGIIHHIEKKEWGKLFSLAYAKLNTGGIFSCGPEPNAGGLFSLAWRSAGFFYKLFDMDYDWEVEKGTLDMKPRKLKDAMKQAGFTDLEIASFQLIPHFHIKILEYIDKKLISYIPGKFSLYIIVKGRK
jgi:SAM-dependent methyltransferase